MNEPKTIREALLADALGDLGRLLDQVQTLLPAMQASRKAVVDAHAKVAAQLNKDLKQANAEFAAVAQQAKVKVAEHVLLRVTDAAREAIDAQRQAIQSTGQTVIRAELERAVQRLAAEAEEMIKRQTPAWRPWVYCLVAASAGSAISLALAAWLLAH
jgi:hypothetical protein